MSSGTGAGASGTGGGVEDDSAEPGGAAYVSEIANGCWWIGVSRSISTVRTVDSDCGAAAAFSATFPSAGTGGGEYFCCVFEAT